MTRVRAQCDRDAGWYVLTARGHAGYCPGNDIVCAAVSATLYALAGALQNLPHDHLYLRVQEGDFAVFCKGQDAAIYGAFLMAEVGLRQIAAAYPEHATLF